VCFGWAFGGAALSWLDSFNGLLDCHIDEHGYDATIIELAKHLVALQALAGGSGVHVLNHDAYGNRVLIDVSEEFAAHAADVDKG
jgi:hypothetical protein